MKEPVAVVGAACAMLCLIFAPQEAIESARWALSLCAELIVPSLLPFFAASALLVRLGVPRLLARPLAPAARRLWGVSGAGAAAFLTGICGGYPLGAQTVAELYRNGQVSRDEAERLLCFCNNSGPSFLVGVIGAGLFSSRRAGLLLYAIHVLAAALTGVFFRGRGGAVQTLPDRPEESGFAAALVESVRSSLAAVLSVCAFIVCFSVFSGLLDSFGAYDAAAGLLARLPGPDTQSARAFLIGLLELSSGVGTLRGLPLSPGRFALAAFLAGWGGLSVHFQTLAVLRDTDLRCRRHTLGRLLCAALSALLALGAALLAPLA